MSSGAALKLRQFISEPLGNKPVAVVPGIDDFVAWRLNEAGYHHAYRVLGQFLLYRKDRERFMAWLHIVSGANRAQQHECYHALKSWCQCFL